MDLVYGPVSSWRLGKSLGIDLINRKNAKVCSYDCVYCSLGETTEKTLSRKRFVDTEEIKRELQDLPNDIETDVITISGTGEPTLARNMGEVIGLIKENFSLPVAVITNSSLMARDDVKEELARADIVVGSLDASNPDLFERLNHPHPEISFQEIVDGMKSFSEKFEGLFSLEVMFVPQNEDISEEIAEAAREIDPHEVQINTPLRSCPVNPLNPIELEKVQEDFTDLETQSVYGSEKPKVGEIIGEEKLDLLKRSDRK